MGVGNGCDHPLSFIQLCLALLLRRRSPQPPFVRHFGIVIRFPDCAEFHWRHQLRQRPDCGASDQWRRVDKVGPCRLNHPCIT